MKSLFTFIIHVWWEDVNGTERYIKFQNDDDVIKRIDCNTTAEIGQEIATMINSISISDIILLNVDLTHRWYDRPDCPAEGTRITFI